MFYSMKLPWVAFILLLLAGFAAAPAQTVTFPDTNLEAAVRQAIPKQSDDITVAAQITANASSHFSRC